MFECRLCVLSVCSVIFLLHVFNFCRCFYLCVYLLCLACLCMYLHCVSVLMSSSMSLFKKLLYLFVDVSTLFSMFRCVLYCRLSFLCQYSCMFMLFIYVCLFVFMSICV